MILQRRQTMESGFGKSKWLLVGAFIILGKHGRTKLRPMLMILFGHLVRSVEEKGVSSLCYKVDEGKIPLFHVFILCLVSWLLCHYASHPVMFDCGCG